jgi:hypothetical protein
MAKMNLMLFLEQLFQRFLLFDGDNAILLFIGVDAPTEHQFYDITDAAMIAIGNSANLINNSLLQMVLKRTQSVRSVVTGVVAGCVAS